MSVQPKELPAAIAREIPSPGIFENMRYYQKDAVTCAFQRLKKTTEPLLLSLPTGSGKSWIIANVAAIIRQIAKDRSGHDSKILALAPSGELVTQNCAKMTQSGFKASIFSARAGQKDDSEDFIFASPLSVYNQLERFGLHRFSAVVVDEAHSMGNAVVEIIEKLRAVNPNLRVLGVTATPYRLGEGYIYRRDAYRDNEPLSQQFASNPYFGELVYEVSAHELIEQGYLAPPVIGDVNEHYQTQKLKRDGQGKWSAKSKEAVFGDSADKTTQNIVKDLKKKTKNRKGVMIFAQSIAHAKRICQLLPKTQVELVTGETPEKERKAIVDRFVNKRKPKYLVNVEALTKGFDATHVDAIAILRATESIALLQQIIGRGLRPCEQTQKTDCLLLDYAQNIRRFCPDGDVFAPRIQAKVPKDSMDAKEDNFVYPQCPSCGNINQFMAISLPQATYLDDYGYIRDQQTDHPILSEGGNKVSGHRGSQCAHYIDQGEGDPPKRCPHLWTSIECQHCQAMNCAHDDACRSCGLMLDKQGNALSARAETTSDAIYSKKIASVESMKGRITQTRKGVECLQLTISAREMPYLVQNEEGGLEFFHPEIESFKVWISPYFKHPSAERLWRAFTEGCVLGHISSPRDLKRDPSIIESPIYLIYQVKPPSNGSSYRFYDVLSYHQEPPNPELLS